MSDILKLSLTHTFALSVLLFLALVPTVSLEAQNCSEADNPEACQCEAGGGVWSFSEGCVGGSQNPGGGGNPGGSQIRGSTKLENPLQVGSIEAFLVAIIRILVVFATPIIVLFIMYAGYLFVTAQGDTGKLEDAKRALLWSVVGGVIVLGAELIAQVIKGTVTGLQL